MTAASILALGFLLGLRHATEADHVAAVATLATRSPSLAHTIAQGMAWGVGHTLTLMLFGGTVLVLGAVVPPHVAQALELAVGVMLVALGADALYRLRRERIHFHAHHHADGVAHFHAHSHRGEGARHDPARHEHRHGFPGRALLVGMVHGMAGSAALVLLSLEALHSPALGFVYIAIFGLGSILGMATLSAAIAVPLRLTSHRLSRAHDGFVAAVGFATLVFGCYIVFHGAGDFLAG
ncbi:MAG: urease accessory protein [Burkholderiales bacterium]|nr:urease accessory protein [Burkholderiales bacterium]